MKSNRQKLRDAIIKYERIKIVRYNDNPFCTSYKHPKTGEKCTWNEASSYKDKQLENLLDRFFPNEHQGNN